jgi:hypothetical protein
MRDLPRGMPKNIFEDFEKKIIFLNVSATFKKLVKTKKLYFSIKQSTIPEKHLSLRYHVDPHD